MALLHGADEPGRSGPGHVEESRRRAPRRRSSVAAGRLRSGNASVHLRHRQPDAGLYVAAARRRPGQPLHLRDRGDQRRHRQDGVVLPDLAARHARLGLGADAGVGRRRLPWQRPAQDGSDRQPQRLLLHARPPDRRAHGDQHVFGHCELGEAAAEFKRQPVREPAKDHHVAGALVSAANGGATNWPPPAYSPDTGLLYVPTAETYAMYYLTETDPRGAMGLGGKDEVSVGTMGSYISAID